MGLSHIGLWRGLGPTSTLCSINGVVINEKKLTKYWEWYLTIYS